MVDEKSSVTIQGHTGPRCKGHVKAKVRHVAKLRVGHKLWHVEHVGAWICVVAVGLEIRLCRVRSNIVD